MIRSGYARSSYNNCVYIRWLENGVGIFLLLYVDDMLVASVDRKEIDKLKWQLSREFEMKDLGKAKKILGIEIIRDENKGVLKISQRAYLEKVLERFGMREAKPVQTPIAQHFKLSSSQCPSIEDEKESMEKIPYSSAVGCLMYSMVCTILDLAYAIILISKFMSDPGKEHWRAVKWVLRYIRRTTGFGLVYRKTVSVQNNL